MRGRAGFTLLEVLVALAILGLGLTAILSAQAGLFASSTYTQNVSYAIGLVRCKMSEVELKLAQEGFPLIDTEGEGPCCGEEEYGGFRCKWKVETVELPPPPPPGGTLGGSEEEGGEGSGQSGLGVLGAIAAMGQTNGALLGDDPTMSDVAKVLTGPSGGEDKKEALASAALGGTSSLAPLVMTIVYPSLKPMLEASIRKVTVAVEWKEGSRDRDLTITQYITQPQQGGFDPNAAEGLGGGGSGSGAGAPAPTTPPTSPMRLPGFGR